MEEWRRRKGRETRFLVYEEVPGFRLGPGEEAEEDEEEAAHQLQLNVIRV